VIVREANGTESVYIYGTFSGSFAEASSFSDGVSIQDRGDLVFNLIDAGWRVDVVAEDDYIAGWILHKGDGKHIGWIYLRPLFRGNIAVLRALIKAFNRSSDTLVTPFLPTRLKWAKRLPLVHRPFLAMGRSRVILTRQRIAV